MRKFHLNLGHPSKADLLRTLKVARARPEILEFVKHKCECEQCKSSAKPLWRRRAHLPETFHFNRLVALDLFYVSVLQESRPVLNVVDIGTSFQQRPLLKTSRAEEVWNAFLRSVGAPVWIARGYHH